MSQRDVDVKITAKDETRGAFASASAELQSLKGAATGVFETIASHWQALLGIMAGGALFKEAVASSVEWTGSVVQLAKRLGTTTEEASGLNIALHHVGMEADDYATIAQKMTKQLRSNEDGFQALGIRTKETNGEWRSTQAVLGDAVDKLNTMKAGTDRNIAAQVLFGARVGDLTALLRLNGTMLEESAEKAKKYHLVIGPDGAAQVRQYKDAMADLKLVGESLEVQMGNNLLPVLLKLSEHLGTQGPRMADAFGAGLKFVIRAALEGWVAVNAFAESVRFLNTVLTTPVDGKYFATVGKAWDDMGTRVTEVNEKAASAIIQLTVLGSHKPGSAAPAGDTLGGDNLKKEKDAHAEYLKQLHQETAELAKGAELGTLRYENLKRIWELQEKLLEQARDPRATLQDRNAAQAAANTLEKANPLAGDPKIALAGPGKGSGKLANITAADVHAPGKPEDIKAQVKIGDDIASGFKRAGDEILVTRASIGALAHDIGDTARSAIESFAGAWATAAQSIASGATSVGAAIAGAARKGVGMAAAAKGQETLLDAAKAFAQGFDNPIQFAVAAKLFAVGTGYELLAGALGGGGAGPSGGGGGGGGGLSSGGFQQSSTATEKLGKLTVVWPSTAKSVLDVNDPDDQLLIKDFFTKLAGNRDIEFIVAGA